MFQLPLNMGRFFSSQGLHTCSSFRLQHVPSRYLHCWLFLFIVTSIQMSPPQRGFWWLSFLKSFNSLLSLRLISLHEIRAFIYFFCSCVCLVGLGRITGGVISGQLRSPTGMESWLKLVEADQMPSNIHYQLHINPNSTFPTTCNPGLVAYNLRALPLLCLFIFKRHYLTKN